MLSIKTNAILKVRTFNSIDTAYRQELLEIIKELQQTDNNNSLKIRVGATYNNKYGKRLKNKNYKEYEVNDIGYFTIYNSEYEIYVQPPSILGYLKATIYKNGIQKSYSIDIDQAQLNYKEWLYNLFFNPETLSYNIEGVAPKSVFYNKDKEQATPIKNITIENVEGKRLC